MILVAHVSGHLDVAVLAQEKLQEFFTIQYPVPRCVLDAVADGQHAVVQHLGGTLGVIVDDAALELEGGKPYQHRGNQR